MTNQNRFTFDLDWSPATDEIEALRDHLIQFNLQHLETDQLTPLAIWCRTDQGERVAGITGRLWGYWLEIKLLWVDKHLRQKGIGAQLLTQIEQVARSKGCRYVLLDTYDFQAKPFYEKHGYHTLFTLPHYPITGQKHYLTKTLDGDPI